VLCLANNYYRYVGNNPVNWVDPWGLAADAVPWVGPLPWTLPGLLNPITVGIGIGAGIILYPSTIADEPPIPIPATLSTDKRCNDDKRCQKVLESCRNECISTYANNPDWLPGTGSDMKGRIRRCIRECMEANGCYNY
jgi:hypothetical protein